MPTLALPVVSAITGGLLIIGQMGLMLSVALTRRRRGQSLGDGGDPAMTRVMRRHGNYAENAAIFVASLSLLEMMGGARLFVAALAAVFIAGRVLHAIGLSQANTVNGWRIAGVFATVVAGVTLGLRLVTLGVGHLSG